MIKIYYYELIDDYVFEGLFDDEYLWAGSADAMYGIIWYSQTKTDNFELMGELEK